MPDLSEPVQALALLPADENLQGERRWLQDSLAWLKSAPPELRAERLRKLADDLLADPAAKVRFRRLWAQAFAPRLYGEAGIPEATQLSLIQAGRSASDWRPIALVGTGVIEIRVHADGEYRGSQKRPGRHAHWTLSWGRSATANCWKGRSDASDKRQ